MYSQLTPERTVLERGEEAFDLDCLVGGAELQPARIGDPVNELLLRGKWRHRDHGAFDEAHVETGHYRTSGRTQLPKHPRVVAKATPQEPRQTDSLVKSHAAEVLGVDCTRDIVGYDCNPPGSSHDGDKNIAWMDCVPLEDFVLLLRDEPPLTPPKVVRYHIVDSEHSHRAVLDELFVKKLAPEGTRTDGAWSRRCKILNRSLRPGRFYIVHKHLDEDGLGEGFEFLECLTSLCAECVGGIENRSDPPLLLHEWQGDLCSEELPSIDVLHGRSVDVPLHVSDCHLEHVAQVRLVNLSEVGHHTEYVLIEKSLFGLTPFENTERCRP